MNPNPVHNNPNLVNSDSESQQNQKSINIGTQTETSCNIGKGTEILDPNWLKNPFDNAQPGDNPLQL